MTPGSGATIAADDVSGVLYQTVKLAVGGDGVAAFVSASSPLPVTSATRAAASANVHAPASNTAAVITYAAGGAGVSHTLGGVAWSYSGVPTSGNLKIEDGSGTTAFSVDVTAAGPGFIPFTPALKGTANTAMIITLAAGGSGVTGKVNGMGKGTE